MDVEAHCLFDDVVTELSARSGRLAREREARCALLAQEPLQRLEGTTQGRWRGRRLALALGVQASAPGAADAPFFSRSNPLSGRLLDSFYRYLG